LPSSLNLSHERRSTPGSPAGRRSAYPSASAGGLRGRDLKLQRDERLITQNPRVVSGLNAVRVSRAKINLIAIVSGDVQPAFNDIAEVPGLAALATRPAA